MQMGQWVHCTCGCGTTGRVVDLSETEAAIKTPEVTLLYPQHALAVGALCFVCGKPAQVVLEVEEELDPCPFCLTDFSRTGWGMAQSGLTFKAAHLLRAEDMVKEGAA